MAVIKNIILDWSGTLVDDMQHVFEANNNLFEQYRVPKLTLEEFKEKFFLPVPEFYKIYLPKFPLEKLDHYYRTSFKSLQSNVALLPEAVPFLEYCQSQKMPLFLLSAIDRDHFEIQSERLKINHYFKQVYVQTVDKRKTILHLLADHDLDPKETLFIGDMLHDIEAAKHAGVVSCAVLTGYDSLAKLRSANPDLLFRSLIPVRNYLERHRSEPDYQPIPAVGALIFDPDDKVLMIRTHKWSHLWGIPGGKIKPNEPAEEALRREILEETGLILHDISFALVTDCIRSTEFYKQAHFVLLNYTGKCAGGEVKLNEEAEEYQWCSLEEASKLELNKPTRLLIDYVRSKRH